MMTPEQHKEFMKECSKPRPYEEHPKWKLREMLIERDEEIKILRGHLKQVGDEPLRLRYVIECERKQNEELKQFKKDVIEATQYDDDLEDQEYIDGIKEMESDYDNQLTDEIEKLKEENKKLKERIKMKDVEIKSYESFTENSRDIHKKETDKIRKNALKQINKLYKQIKQMKDDWETGTEHIAEELSVSLKENKEIKNKLRKLR
jgi:hypothetical protein